MEDRHDAYDAGQAAYEEGEGKQANPFDYYEQKSGDGDNLYMAWKRGWTDARDEDDPLP